MEFQIKEINRSFRKFNNYSKDFLNSNHSSFRFNLSKFITYCNSDPIISHIMKPLVSGTETIDEDYNNFVNGYHKVILPISEEKRLAVIYKLLENMSNGKPTVEGLAICIFPTSRGNFDYYVSIFLEQIFFSFARDIQDRLNDFLEDNEETTTISEEELCIFKNCIINIDKSKHVGGDQITITGSENNLATNGSTIQINSNEELKNSLEKIAEELKNNNKNQEAINAVLKLSNMTDSGDIEIIKKTTEKAIEKEPFLKEAFKKIVVGAGVTLAGNGVVEGIKLALLALGLQ